MDLPSHFKQPSSPLVDLNTIHSKNLRKIPQLSNEPSIPEPLLRPNNLPGPAKPNRIDDSSSSDDEDLNDPILRQARDLGPLAGKQSGGAEEGEKEEGKDEKDEEEEEDDEDDKQMENSLSSSQLFSSLSLPCSHEVLLQGHSKSVTALCLDKAGHRIATGGYDYKVRLWDFNGMNKNMNSFRILEPIEGHPIRNLSFSINNNDLLVIAGNSQPKILNRDGKEIAECIKGDMYIKDMNQTKGHISMVYDGCFLPYEANLFASCSLDGTIRVWDRNMKLINIEQQLTQKQVFKCRDSRGLKTGVYSLAVSKEHFFLGACFDGSIQGFSPKTHGARPDLHIPSAHQSEREITKVLFFNDDKRFVTRSLDNTMKIWDIRQTKKPLKVFTDLPNREPGSKICLSPSEDYVLTGSFSSQNGRKPISRLNFFSTVDFEKKAELPLGEYVLTDIAWHPALNQIFFGGTDHNAHVLYDVKRSQKGAMLCLTKEPKKIHFDEIEDRRNIIVPHSLPLFKDSNGNKRRKYEKMRQDALITKKPELPLQGPGKGGKIGGASTVTQFLMRSVHEGVDRREDSQKALLKFAEQAEKNPQFVNMAYKDTQPKPIFDFSTPEYKEQELLSRLDKICPGCGLKICKCSRKYGEND